MDNTINEIRNSLKLYDEGCVSRCDLIRSVQVAIASIDAKHFAAERAAELEASTDTLVHLTESDKSAQSRILSAIKSLREIGYYVSHTEEGVFYCVSPEGSFEARTKTESKNPRFFLDVYSEAEMEDWKE